MKSPERLLDESALFLHRVEAELPAEQRGILKAVHDKESILKDKKKILPCAAYLEGEYGYNDLFIGVPVKLGANGVEEVIEITLLDEEKAALDKSADAVKELKELLIKLG